MDAAARAIPALSKTHRAIGVNRAAQLVFGSGVYNIDPAKRGFMFTYFLCHLDPEGCNVEDAADNFLKAHRSMWVGDTLYDKVLNCLTFSKTSHYRATGLYYTWICIFPG